MARPRIYNTNAERQKAYRDRVRAQTPPRDARNADLVTRVLRTHDQVMRGGDGGTRTE